MRSAVVVDTNVPVVANRKADHAGPECVLRCTERLEAVRNREIILLDEPGLIMTEYTLHLSRSGQPGVGDIFMKLVSVEDAMRDGDTQIELAQLPQMLLAELQDFRWR